MKFSKKIAIFATVELFSLGGAAYTYDRYGVQDNSMILANVEALAEADEENKENGEGGNGKVIYVGPYQSQGYCTAWSLENMCVYTYTAWSCSNHCGHKVN